MTSKKKTKLWNKIIILIIAALVIFTFTSQESGFAARLYIEGMQENSSDQLQGEQGRIKRVKATLDEIILETHIEDLSLFERDVDGLVFTQLSLPYSGITEEIGKPELPSFGQFFAVPNGAQMKVEVLEVEYETIPDVLVYPTQEPLPDCAPLDENGQDARPFAFDRDFYALEGDYPNQVITVDPVTSIRGVHASVAHFYPVKYNPGLKELTVYSYIKVRISFTGGSRSIGDLSKRAKAFEGIYGNLLINYDSLEQVDYEAINAENQGESGVQFLIITVPEFETAANLLAAHRQAQGITTAVVTTDVTGSNSTEIQAYIQDAYDTWDVPLEYVLLLGDAEHIPTNYITGHPYHDNELIGTDLYYATVDGTDYDADILLGRISVDSSTQATDRINRIINYPAAGTHYDKIALASFFQDYNDYDGYEDRRFVLTSEEIRDYLLTQSYDVQRIYNTDNDVTPTNWSTTYGDGSPIPSELLRSNGFAWDGDAADITSTVNDGVLILQHRDHGARWGWGDPYYTDSNVNALTNGDKQPVVFSMNCQTGWFDNETDENSGTTASTSIFSEAWERNPNGGAVGIVAATRVSYSGYNDYLTLGMYDAIWPNFLPYNNTSFDRPEYRLSAVLNYGKLAMRTLWSGSSTYNLIETEMFHYFGDPTMYLGEFGPSQPGIYTYLPLIMNSSVPCSPPPTLISPANESTLDTLIPVFQWENGDVPDAISFRMQIARDIDFTEIVRSLWSSGTPGIHEFQFPSNLDPSTTYYWRAWLDCYHSQSPYSEVWSFTTGSDGTILPAPNLLSPANNSLISDVPITIEWSPVTGADYYNLWWHEVGSTTYFWQKITTAQTELHASDGVTIEWWISAVNNYAVGSNSEIWQFTTNLNSTSGEDTNSDDNVFIQGLESIDLFINKND